MHEGRGAVEVRPSLLGLAVAVVAAALVLFFFAPRFVYWRSLEAGQWLGGAETHRAFSTLEQLRDPWAPVTSRPNVVIAWRLLFPVTWHALGLPSWPYLALPHVGCLLTLWLMAWLNHQRFGEWSQTLAATALSATLPWFFVSTGWLAYFDSWLVLGLLVVSFVPSRLALGAACLLTPWVDERLVVALPVAFLVRVVALSAGQTRDLARWKDAAVVAAASLPYPILRAVAWWGGESLSPTYVLYHWEHIRAVPWARLLEGLWSGFRAGWLVIGAALWLAPRRLGRAWGALFALVVVASSLAGLAIAGDMSRTMAIEVPVLVLGAWLWHEAQPARFRRVLLLVLGANLLLPAEHVLWVAKVPIRYIYAQLDEWEHPPAPFQPAYHLGAGNAARQRNDRAGAQAAYELAIRLDRGFAPAYVARAALRIEGQDWAGARADVDAALRADPAQPDALFLRAVLSQADGAAMAAAADLRRALEVAPPDWVWREEARRRLADAESRSSPPAP